MVFRTIEELEASGREMLTAENISKIVGADAQSIRLQAYDDPSKLGYPVTVVRRRVSIPREGFINWMRGSGSR